MDIMEKLGFEDLKGKVIFLTGASNGIGRAAALLFSSFGAKLALAARSVDKLEMLSEEIVASGAEQPLILSLDARSETDCIEAIEKACAEFGKIDVLINNAGVGLPTPDLAEAETDKMTAMIETNYNGVFYLTRQALKHMKAAKKGQIVMVSSSAGIEGNPTAPLYCASKFALEGYTDGLRKQSDAWTQDGIDIRITNIKPGSVDSGYWGKRDVPRQKFMTCEEMASVFFWAVAAKSTMNVYDIRMESRK
jgi:NADP-dependent 3-hydroxy acid dehydrogenase YdfG